mmetsp:Transcript_39102/g.103010  ORF Transcript_39102/g.103010 Transcript_39102/m.103010 type:complete len:275 (+) Transcript_39102:17-841(+)|eukprot:CAMPEP_0115850492 /NCGR_PEP_ID=MMETSP0287-20121206/11992_1 /TAXON_ID=412157 /ORGANISM="Chrysochromulina rotalis, Strain UIO044" /LENGTH=274 /DNA_ID=CAMNT_0003304491 /DNA_START=17 /DNA_END=841 /DNA_ORIENTATION=+
MRLPASAVHASKSALLATLTAVTLTTTPLPARALPPTLDSVIIEATDASVPILKALEPGAFQSWTELLGKIALEIKPDKLGKSLDLLIDVYNTVPSADVDAFSGVIKDSFAGLKTDSCTLVPLPSLSVAERFKGLATQQVEAGKLHTFNAKWSGTLQGLSKTDSSICLPPVAALEKLAIAQADVGRAFEYNAVKRFNDYTFPMLKSEAKLTDETFALLQGAQGQAADATFKEKSDFQNVLKKLESAAKKEKEKVALARVKADAMAKAAAKKSVS